MALLEQFNSGELFVMFLVGTGILAGIVIPVSIVAICQWRAVRDRECTTFLTDSMLAQGFSSEEIERVLQAGHHPAENPELRVRHGNWSRPGKVG